MVRRVTKNSLVRRGLKASTSSRVDGISSNLLKQIIPEIINVLIHIFNCSLSTGIVSSKLKIAKVNPVFKSSDKCEVTKYRPISKLLERLFITSFMTLLQIKKFSAEINLAFAKKKKILYVYGNQQLVRHNYKCIW